MIVPEQKANNFKLKTIKITLVIGLILLSVHTLFAQHTDIQPQQNDQNISRIKANKIKRAEILIVSGGASSPFGAINYDINGRIIRYNEPMHRQSITYTADGRISAYVDSANDGRRFWKKEYSFGYDESGKPKTFIIDKVKSDFSYDAATRKLTEIITQPSGQNTCTYLYNEEDKVIEETTINNLGFVLRHVRYVYNKYGDLQTSVAVSKGTDGIEDSIVTLHTYDSKGNILRKQIISTHLVAGGTDEANIPDYSEQKAINNTIYSFAYDMNGNRISETFTSPTPKDNYRKQWEYDKFGLVGKETTFDASGKEKQVLVFKYQ